MCLLLSSLPACISIICACFSMYDQRKGKNQASKLSAGKIKKAKGAKRKEPSYDPLTRKLFEMHCLFWQKPPPHFLLLSFYLSPFPIPWLNLLFLSACFSFSSFSPLFTVKEARNSQGGREKEKERKKERKKLQSLT